MSNTIVNSTTLTGWELILKLFPFFKEEIADWRLIPTSDVDTHLESKVDVVSVYSCSVVVLAVFGVPGNLMLLCLSLHREIRTVSHSEKTEDQGEGNTNKDDEDQSSIAVVVCNLMAAVAMAPFIFVTTLLLDEFPRNIATTEYEQNLADAIPYTNVVYCVCLAANLYILLATSRLSRNVARRSLAFCRLTRFT